MPKSSWHPSRNSYVLEDSGMESITRVFRIPRDYFELCPPGLQLDNLNGWLEELGEKPLYFQLKGNRITEFSLDDPKKE